MEKNDFGIALARCEANIGSQERLTGMTVQTEVTEPFELFFRDIDGEDFLDRVCEQAGKDLLSDMTNLGKAVLEVIEKEAADFIEEFALTVEIVMYLTEDNRVVLHTDDNIREIYEGPDAVKVRYMAEGIRKAYEYHYGIPTMMIWDKYINMAFKEPDRFKEVFEEI